MKSEHPNNQSNKLDFDEFKERLKTVTCATGIEKTSLYGMLRFEGDAIKGIRFQTCFTESDFTINLKKLHAAYCALNKDEIDTTDLKEFVKGKQAPALAILIEAGLVKHKK